MPKTFVTIERCKMLDGSTVEIANDGSDEGPYGIITNGNIEFVATLPAAYNVFNFRQRELMQHARTSRS